MNLHYLDPIQGLVHDESGPEDAPPAIYLPGVHGDAHLLERARPWLSLELRLFEVTYPRPEGWSLARYAEGLEDLMDVLDLESAHLIGESFGSLVGFEFGLTRPGRVRSLSMVGGFCRPTAGLRAGVARRALASAPGLMLEKGLELYSSIAGRGGDEDLDWAAVPRVATQSPRARRAAANRLAIIGRTDFTSLLGRVQFPVRYIGGGGDRAVRVHDEVRLLRRRLPASAEFESHIIPGAPHAILASHPRPTAERLSRWVAEMEEA